MLRRARETFHFGGPEDPSVTIDLTDRAIGMKAAELRKYMSGEMELFERAMSGELTDDDADGVADMWRTAITSICGGDAYESAVEWVSCGEEIDARDLNLVLAPLVTWCVSVMNDVLNANAESAKVRYLRDAPDAL